jgi:hypothetical protein
MVRTPKIHFENLVDQEMLLTTAIEQETFGGRCREEYSIRQPSWGEKAHGCDVMQAAWQYRCAKCCAMHGTRNMPSGYREGCVVRACQIHKHTLITRGAWLAPFANWDLSGSVERYKYDVQR